MNARGLTIVLALGAMFAGPAYAQTYSTDRYYGSASGDYDYARVIRVDPIIGSDRYGSRTTSTQQRCYTRTADDDYVYEDGYSNGYYGDGSYRDDRYRDDRYEDDRYNDDRYGDYGDDTGRTVATVIGGIAGAVLGNQIGGGNGRYVGTAVGSVVGGMAGRSVYDSTQRNRRVQRGTVRVCDPVRTGGYGGYDGYNGYNGDGSVTGYDVTYEYAGRTYHTRTDHHPGDRIRVRVDVRAD